MNRILLLFFFCVQYCLQGQVGPCTMSNGEETGDLFFKLDELPDLYSIGAPGDNNSWFFTNLQAPRSLTYQYAESSFGRYASHFPEAEKVVREPSGKETFLFSRSGNYYQLGYAELSKGSLEPKIVRYTVPVTACVPELSNRHSLYETQIDRSEDRIIYSDVKDASGVLYLPDEIYDAYRTTRQITEASGESSVGHTEYIFTDQLTGELLMIVKMKADNSIDNILYRIKNAPSLLPATVGVNQFLLYPNTGYGEVRLEFQNFNTGRYTFIIFDIVNRELWRTSYDIVRDITLKEDLSFLPRGTYTYMIVDENLNRIVTRRLAIIKS